MGIFLPQNRQALYLRITIPQALRSYFKGRREVWRSLRTPDREQAQVHAFQIEGQAKRVFFTLKRYGHLMDNETIERLVAQWLDTALDEADEAQLVQGPVSDHWLRSRDEDLQGYYDILNEHLLGNEFHRMTEQADDLLKSAGLPPLNHESQAFKQLCKRLLEAHLEYTKRQQARLNGEYRAFNGLEAHVSTTSPTPVSSQRSSPSALGRASTNPSPLGRVPSNSKRFGEVVKLYYEENPSRSPRSHRQVLSEINRFMMAVGGDQPINRITKEACRAYKDSLMQTRGLALRTVSKWICIVSSIFRWAMRQGYTPDEFRNPLEGLEPSARRVREASSSNRDYTDAELLAVFGSHKFREQRHRRPDHYFLVLICLFSGCRREEPAQLYLHDIQEQDGIPYFNFTDEGEDQQLKGESKRKVPIHSALLQLGFMEYVQRMKESGAVRLFPKFKKGKSTFADATGKWYARVLKKAGLKGLVLHGLRHTFITRLSNLGGSEKLQRMLTGHAAHDVHSRVYDHVGNVPMKLLKEELEKLQYPEVFQTLKTKTTTDKAA